MLPHEIRIYLDLLELNLESFIQDKSALEMLQIWLDRQNKKGFEYESKTAKGEKELKHDFLYFIKTSNG